MKIVVELESGATQIHSRRDPVLDENGKPKKDERGDVVLSDPVVTAQRAVLTLPDATGTEDVHHAVVDITAADPVFTSGKRYRVTIEEIN